MATRYGQNTFPDIIGGLNIAYEVGESRSWWKKYLVASGLTIVCLVLFAFAVLLLIHGGRFSETHGPTNRGV